MWATIWPFDPNLKAHHQGMEHSRDDYREAHGNLTKYVEGIEAKRDQVVMEIAHLKTALADAIRRPMGVIPASAEGLIHDDEIRRAESHRMEFKPDGERIISFENA